MKQLFLALLLLGGVLGGALLWAQHRQPTDEHPGAGAGPGAAASTPPQGGQSGGRAGVRLGPGLPGDLPGWKRVFADDFRTPAGLGDFPGTGYSARWRVYPDGWPDTTGHGTYMPSKVLSVHDGVLDYWVHTRHGRHLVAAALPKMTPGAYGRYSVRFRSDTLPGYKVAWLLWPDSKRFPEDGEIDFPEGNLDSSMHAYMHFARRGGGQNSYHTREYMTRWHVATTTWEPGRVTFDLDGRTVGVSTTHVPHNPMHWVLQTETATNGDVPVAKTQGHVQVDWVAAWEKAPAAKAPPASGRGGAGDIVLAAVGDAHPPTTDAWNSGRVAASIRAANPDAVLFLGDFQYEHGDCDTLVRMWDRDGWGALMPKLLATAGPTHDWAGPDDTDSYRNHLAGSCPGQSTGPSLADRATDRRIGPGDSYEVDLGAWRVYSLSSGLWRYDQTAARAATSWLRRSLAEGRAAGDHPLVIWHEPYWTSSTDEHGPQTDTKPWIDLLDEYDVPLVLSGHQHGYERFLPQDADGTVDQASGTQQFVVGTGGIGLYTWTDQAANSATRQADAYGWLRLTLRPDGHYTWRFVRTGGAAYSDSGSR